MRRFPSVLTGLIIVLPLFALSGFPRQARQEGRVPAEQAEAKLPPAVLQAIEANCPGAVIDKMEVEKEGGIVLYDIEFKARRGEIEVAEDGTVMDVATIVDLKDVPGLAADAIRRAAIGATITQVEKSEVRAEIKTEGGRGRIIKVVPPKYVYEAELAKGELKGEVQVGPDGKIVEGPKWRGEEAGKREEMGEKEEAEENEEAEEVAEVKARPGVDLKLLPPAVLEAFRKAYPKAVIRGTDKETENGVTYYEIESVDGKMSRDLLYAADGKVAEIEEALAPGALPAAVLQTLAKAYPGYKILKAEDLLKDGKKFFELQLQVKDKKVGVTIDPSGKIVE
jgi:uncharacterized membrane protein YkoI